MKYKAYLASREWALKREAVRKRSGNKCERCKTGPQDAVHHLTYEHVGNEPLEDLQAICDPCHEFLSGTSRFDPACRHPAEIAAEEWEAQRVEHELAKIQKHLDEYSKTFDGFCPHCDEIRLLVRILKTQELFCDNCGKDII